MIEQRGAGILLHPVSLPGKEGIGTIGKMAYAWIDRLAWAQQHYWQILPLTPIGDSNSPYQSISAFAGEPLLIDQSDRVENEFCEGMEEASSIDYQSVRIKKSKLLQAAFEDFKPDAAFESFCQTHHTWLETYALFMALKEAHGGAPWYQWEEELKWRHPEAIQKAKQRYHERILYHQYLQYLFFTQWQALKHYANQQSVWLIGDMPIYVSHDSADVWASPELFLLDEEGMPTHVAGVPPDAFSATGQWWGNPLYRWDRMAQTSYAWWVARMKHALWMYDLVRIDHFRGFAAYWAIKASASSAAEGRWVAGPGAALFERLKDVFPSLPIIAEDLGIITSDVELLRDTYTVGGMKILQFAFDSDASNPYLPHNHTRKSIVYTGTHDNDTTIGWFQKVADPSRIEAYLCHQEGSIAWRMITQAYASVAQIAIIPMQDILGLGSEARMNRPGIANGNWCWRMRADQMDQAPYDALKRLAWLYGRS